MAQREVSDEEIASAKRESVRLKAAHGFLYVRLLPDGRVIYLAPLFTGHRLGISVDQFVHEYYAVWDYPFDEKLSPVDASWRAALGWDGEGEPEGWYRHPHTGRRRPDGDASKEHVRW